MPTFNIKNDKVAIGENASISASLKINENWKVSGYFPVGSLYFNINNINPSNYFGGTWERYAKGRVLVGVDENDSDFQTEGQTGGESTHTLTATEMVSHRHQLRQIQDSVASGSIAMILQGSGTIGFESDSVGGGQPHNNLMPFATCYIWKRTA